MFALRTLRSRLLALGAASLFGLLMAGGFGLFQLARLDRGVAIDLAQMGRAVDIVFDVQNAGIDFKTQVQEWKNTLIRGNDPEQFKRYRDGFETQAAAVAERLGSISARLKEDASPRAAEVDALIAAHSTMLASYRTALQSFDAADPESGKKVDRAVKGIDRSTTDAMTALTQGMAEDVKALGLRTQAHTASLYQTGLTTLVIAISLLSLILVTGVVLTVRRLAHSLQSLRAALATARERLDLTVKAPDHLGDELSEAGASINALFGELRSVLRQMRDNAQHIASHSSSLHGSVSTLAAAVSQQNDSTSNMAAAAEELAVSVAHVSDSAGSARDVSRSSTERAEFGGGVIGSASGAMSKAAQDVHSTMEGMNELGTSMAHIGKIAATIKDIADQTNLLALNAAIEAARAGEQGRGFAVVADEVRKLAERTALATREIDAAVDTVQSVSSSAVGNMTTLFDQFDQFERIGASTHDAGLAIAEIQAESRKVLGATEDISRALLEQTSASESIARQVECIAGMSETNRHAVVSVGDAADAMNSLSQSMRQRLEKFVV
ncbi:methyl-accepting chemotaxis protein [Methyloversatilis sp.]|uniref:methyl-accepting chemotaxis protein n=1 Tax=Methyloversatilis sp. TaxID=2569862 RepID=UPI0027B9AA3B|nr:methyl-accepting chemotaxis protein [Methyloversatilis sp.]